MSDSTLYPDKTTTFVVYLNGGSNILGVATVDLPDVQFMRSSLSGAGLGGELETPVLGHTQSVELTLNWTTVNSNVFLSLENNGNEIVCRSAQQYLNLSDSKIEVKPVIITAKGMPKGASLGSFELGAQTGGSTTFEVTYLTIQVGDETTLNMDKLNNVFEINGEDQLADVASALGLS